MNNMNNSLIGIMVALVFVGMGSSARGGSLDAPAGPTDPNSAMFTLEDIYQVLDTHTTNVTKRTSFKEPTAGPTTGTMHNLNDIMTLAKRAPVPKTGQTNTWAVGDDGTNRIGVAWPNPRFTVQGDTNVVDVRTNCVLDNLTGLIWARNANLASGTGWSTDGKVTWSNAFEVISNSSSGVVNRVNYGGTNDWRLPNLRELQSLVDYGQTANPALPTGHPFKNVQNSPYWSSTTAAYGTDYAWDVTLWNTGVANVSKTTTYYVLPVRDGQ